MIRIYIFRKCSLFRIRIMIINIFFLLRTLTLSLSFNRNCYHSFLFWNNQAIEQIPRCMCMKYNKTKMRKTMRGKEREIEIVYLLFIFIYYSIFCFVFLFVSHFCLVFSFFFCSSVLITVQFFQDKDR